MYGERIISFFVVSPLSYHLQNPRSLMPCEALKKALCDRFAALPEPIITTLDVSWQKDVPPSLTLCILQPNSLDPPRFRICVGVGIFRSCLQHEFCFQMLKEFLQREDAHNSQVQDTEKIRKLPEQLKVGPLNVRKHHEP